MIAALGWLLAASARAEPSPAGPPPGMVLVVVRHAEKAAAPEEDPPLTPQGEARAAALARTLTDLPLVGVHSTETARTRATAAPTAAAHGLPVRPYDALSPLWEQLRREGGAHLVVGHSNTIDALVREAGGDPGAAVAPTEYDRLYVLTWPSGGPPITVRLRYGP